VLTADQQSGLFGELWLLLNWVLPITPGAFSAWHGPLGGRHDFVTSSTSVEVKTTRSNTGPIVHRISGLDQLAPPSSGKLYLLSVRAVRDPLAADSLDSLIDRALEAARVLGPTTADALDDRLSAAGWATTDVGRYSETYRVTVQELFVIEADFPRLTADAFPEGLPPGIVDVSYALDTSACRPWRIAEAPTFGGPLAGVGSE
jgi:hypothetical protein